MKYIFEHKRITSCINCPFCNITPHLGVLYSYDCTLYGKRWLHEDYEKFDNCEMIKTEEE